MSEIATKTQLLDWLAEQLEDSAPQGPIIERMIHVFDDVVSLFNEFGRFYSCQYDWFDYLQETFGIINRFPAQQTCSLQVLDFLATVYGESTATDEHVTRERAIVILAEMLDLDDRWLKHTRTDGRGYLVSTPRFEEVHGSKVRVRLARAKARRRDHDALSPDFEI